MSAKNFEGGLIALSCDGVVLVLIKTIKEVVNQG